MKTRNQLKTAFLLGSLIGLCMLVGHLLGGPQGLLLGLVFGGIGNFVAYWFSDRIALTTMQAQPVSRAEAPYPDRPAVWLNARWSNSDSCLP